MTGTLRVAAVWLLALAVLSAQAPAAPACARCGWRPPQGRIVRARTVAEIERAVAAARPGDTILIAPGRYALTRMIDIAIPRVTLRGETGAADAVVLHGAGMTGDHVGVGVSVSAPDTTVADLTIRDVRYHAVQVRGESGAARAMLHNLVMLDVGQQVVKVSTANDGRDADGGIVACSRLGFTNHAPSDYTNGVDVLRARDWQIRDNRIERIRGPAAGRWAAGPAILAWRGAEGTIVERNVIVDSHRGIAIGLEAASPEFTRPRGGDYDHRGGVVRHNVIVNLHDWADEGIEINGAPGVRVEHNTVLVEGTLGWSIRVRFPASSAIVRNNLTSRMILELRGGRADMAGNVVGALQAWFVNPAAADLHLTAAAGAAMDAGVVIDDVTLDFDRLERRTGRAPDAGAFEWRGGK